MQSTQQTTHRYNQIVQLVQLIHIVHVLYLVDYTGITRIVQLVQLIHIVLVILSDCTCVQSTEYYVYKLYQLYYLTVPSRLHTGTVRQYNQYSLYTQYSVDYTHVQPDSKTSTTYALSTCILPSRLHTGTNRCYIQYSLYRQYIYSVQPDITKLVQLIRKVHVLYPSEYTQPQPDITVSTHYTHRNFIGAISNNTVNRPPNPTSLFSSDRNLSNNLHPGSHVLHDLLHVHVPGGITHLQVLYKQRTSLWGCLQSVIRSVVHVHVHVLEALHTYRYYKQWGGVSLLAFYGL